MKKSENTNLTPKNKKFVIFVLLFTNIFLTGYVHLSKINYFYKYVSCV